MARLNMHLLFKGKGYQKFFFIYKVKGDVTEHGYVQFSYSGRFDVWVVFVQQPREGKYVGDSLDFFGIRQATLKEAKSAFKARVKKLWLN